MGPRFKGSKSSSKRRAYVEEVRTLTCSHCSIWLRKRSLSAFSRSCIEGEGNDPLRSDPFCDPWSGNELIVSSSLAFEVRIFRWKRILFPSLLIERKSRYLSIHIRINKCGSRDRSIAPHQQLEEEKGMMSRPVEKDLSAHYSLFSAQRPWSGAWIRPEVPLIALPCRIDPREGLIGEVLPARLVFSLQLGEADKKSYQMLFPAHPSERGTVLAEL